MFDSEDIFEVKPTGRTPRRFLLASKLMLASMIEAFKMLQPVKMNRNPVMVVAGVGTVLTTFIAIDELMVGAEDGPYYRTLSLLLWMTLWLANLIEAVAIVQGRVKAEELRKGNAGLRARPVSEDGTPIGVYIPAAEVTVGNRVLVQQDEVIPADGRVVAGGASVDQSMITGDPSPVIRESNNSNSLVVGGSRVISGWLVVEVERNPKDSILERKAMMFEDAGQRVMPDRFVAAIILLGLLPLAILADQTLFSGDDIVLRNVDLPLLLSLLVSLSPTANWALLASIRSFGMAKLAERNVVTLSAEGAELAGHVNVLLLDSGNLDALEAFQVIEAVPAPGVTLRKLVESARNASLFDESPEGRGLVTFARKIAPIHDDSVAEGQAEPIGILEETGLTGVTIGERQFRKGHVESMEDFIIDQGGAMPEEVIRDVSEIAAEGGVPFVVCENQSVLGTVHLKAVGKAALRQRLAKLRRAEVISILTTESQSTTAATVAADLGFDDFLAEATPDGRLELIRCFQSEGQVVALRGDPETESPALAQADLGLATSMRTPVAKNTGNMIDLSPNCTKLLDVVLEEKERLRTRSSLYTFNITSDVAKYFAIVPAIFTAALPQIQVLNVMSLTTPKSAVLSAVTFNALVLSCFIPLTMRGMTFPGVRTTAYRHSNLLVYGTAGLLASFLGIKLIDVLIEVFGWV